MDFAGSKYYELNRALLLSIGLWPYEKSAFKRIKILVSSSFLGTGFAATIAKIITSRYDTTIMLRTLSTTIPCLIAIVKYITFLLIPASLKELMERVQNDWNILKDTKELEIIRRYTHFGRLCTLFFSVFGYMSMFGLLILICAPSILDVVMPLNETRERKLIVDVEYFIDQDEYFFTVSCLIIISVIFCITTTLATEMLYIVYVHHVCGMFKITCYRLRHAFDQHALAEASSSAKGRATICAKIIKAIEIHKRAIGFHDFLWSKLAVSYFIMLTIGVISLSINLFRVSQAIVLMDINELIIATLFVFVHFFYMFFGNLAGQVFIDHSINVHRNVCDTRWYHVPLREQKLMLFILHRSMHSCKLVTGGTFVLSLEGFTTLIATAISYFTVLSSVQN